MSRRSSAATGIPAREPPTIPLRERFRREVSAAIALAAEQVFAEEGLRDAHVGHIAKRAGVAVGTLYNYYEDRDALLAAVLRERNEELFSALGVAMAEVEGEHLATQVRTLVRAHLGYFSSVISLYHMQREIYARR